MKKMLLLTIAFTSFAIMFSISMVGPLLSAFAEKYDIPLGSKPNTSIGIIFSIGGLTLALFQYPFGRIADKMGRKQVIAASSLIVSLSILGMGYADKISRGLQLDDNSVLMGWGPSTIILATFRGFQGLGAAGTWPVLMAIIASNMERDKMGVAMGVFGASFGLGMSLGPVIGPLLGELYSLRTPFVFSSILALVATIISLKLPDKPLHKEVTKTSRERTVLDKRLILLSLTGFSLLYTMGGLVVIFPRYLTNILKLDLHHIAGLMGAASITFSILQPFSGKIVDRANKLAIIILLTPIATSSLLLSYLSESTTILYLSMFLFGLTGSIVYPAINALTGLIAPPGREAQFTGIYNAISSMGITISPIVMGLLGDLYGYKTSFISPLFLGALSSILWSMHLLRTNHVKL